MTAPNNKTGAGDGWRALRFQFVAPEPAAPDLCRWLEAESVARHVLRVWYA
jgi:hypothetical protein